MKMLGAFLLGAAIGGVSVAEAAVKACGVLSMEKQSNGTYRAQLITATDRQYDLANIQPFVENLADGQRVCLSLNDQFRFQGTVYQINSILDPAPAKVKKTSRLSAKIYEE